MPIACRIRVAILVIVAALCVVPPLVRATFSGSSATPIRLNRGFELPPAKATLPPPQRVAVMPVSYDSAEPATRERFSPITCEVGVGPLSAPAHAPDPLRGPPLPTV